MFTTVKCVGSQAHARGTSYSSEHALNRITLLLDRVQRTQYVIIILVWFNKSNGRHGFSVTACTLVPLRTFRYFDDGSMKKYTGDVSVKIFFEFYVFLNQLSL